MKLPALILAPSLLLSGCSTFYSTPVGESLQLFFWSTEAYKDYALRLPYASILVNYSGKEALLILAEQRGTESVWISSLKETLVTRHGRIVRTSLQQTDILGTRLSPQDPLASDENRPDTYRVYLNLYQQYPYSLKATGQWVCDPLPQSVRLVKRDAVLQHCQEELLWENGLTITNDYWLDEQLQVWKSRQTPFPGSPSLEYTLVKSFRGND